MSGERSYNWPEIAAFGFSIVAIVISGYSLLEGRRQHQDERNAEVLEAVYADWVTLAERDDWRVQHLIEAPDTYAAVRDLIRTAATGLSDEEKARALLAERSMANLIFTNFEHLLKQWMLAERQEDETRLEVLKEEVDFYAEVYLRNPRLLWLWSEEGDGWTSQADPSSIAWYADRVLNDPELPLTVRPDAEGIVPDFDWPAARGE